MLSASYMVAFQATSRRRRPHTWWRRSSPLPPSSGAPPTRARCRMRLSHEVLICTKPTAPRVMVPTSPEPQTGRPPTRTAHIHRPHMTPRDTPGTTPTGSSSRSSVTALTFPRAGCPPSAASSATRTWKRFSSSSRRAGDPKRGGIKARSPTRSELGLDGSRRRPSEISGPSTLL